MSDALEQARRAQHDAAVTTFVRIPLDVLEALIDEIEMLQEHLLNYQAMYPDAKFSRMQPRLVKP
jgi:hypothetical protein